MIESISAITLATHEMPRAVRFYRALGFEVLHGGEESSFTSFRAGPNYLNLIAQPAAWLSIQVIIERVGVENRPRHCPIPWLFKPRVSSKIVGIKAGIAG